MDCYPWLDSYLMSKAGAVQEFKVAWQWLRYMVGGKQFAAVCTPDPKYQPHNGRPMVLLKCDPLLAEAFRGQYPDIVPGFYSDKRCWNSVYLDGAVPEDVVRDLCDMSYTLVASKLTKAVRQELAQLKASAESPSSAEK